MDKSYVMTPPQCERALHLAHMYGDLWAADESDIKQGVSIGEIENIIRRKYGRKCLKGSTAPCIYDDERGISVFMIQSSYSGSTIWDIDMKGNVQAELYGYGFDHPLISVFISWNDIEQIICVNAMEKTFKQQRVFIMNLIWNATGVIPETVTVYKDQIDHGNANVTLFADWCDAPIAIRKGE